MKVYGSDEGDESWKYEWLKGSDYDYRLLTDGDTFSFGNIQFGVIHTPGHTPESLSFLVTDRATTDEPMGVLTGDFIFVGDVGRPDLLETAAGQKGAMKPAAQTLYQSIQEFKTLPGSILATFDKNFNTISGSYVDPGKDIYLIIEEEHADQAYRDLIRVSLDNVKGYSTPSDLAAYGGELKQVDAVDFDYVASHYQDDKRQVLDVRSIGEYKRVMYRAYCTFHIRDWRIT